MNRSTLIPSGAEVELICLRPKAGVIQVELHANQPSSLCPSCGRRSSRVHSRYWRTIADLPWEGIPVRILLQARKFFCGDERCSRRIFTEQLPTTVARYARRISSHRNRLSRHATLWLRCYTVRRPPVSSAMTPIRPGKGGE